MSLWIFSVRNRGASDSVSVSGKATAKSAWSATIISAKNLVIYIMKVAVISIIILSAVGLAGCAEVQPWERGNLAKPQMALDPHPLQSEMRGHNYGSREAAGGGNMGSGGGCGCY